MPLRYGYVAEAGRQLPAPGPASVTTVAPETTATHCPYCSMQCGIKLVAGDGGPGLEPWLDFPTNRGRLCQKGWTAAELLGHPDRLTEPLLRDAAEDPLRPPTTVEALGRAAGA